MPKYQDPNFDKKTYQWRRAKGLRGQLGSSSARGIVVSRDGPGKPFAMPWATTGNKPVSKKARLKNTKRARKEAMNASN